MNAYTEKATRVSKAKSGSGERGVRGSAKTRTPPQELAKIRSWARGQGMEVSDRGRVSEAVKDSYNEAH